MIALFYKLIVWQNEKTLLGKVAKFFCFLIYSSFFISLVCGVYLSDDKNESIFLAAMSLAVGVIIVKLNYMLWLQEEIYNFIYDIGTHSMTDEKEFLKCTKKIDNFMNFVTAFLTMTLFGVIPIFVFCLPIFSNEKKLPLKIAFPWNYRHNECAYWAAYFYTLFGYLYTLVCMLVTIIIWYVMLNCSIKYESLANQFRNMSFIGTRNITTKSVNENNLSEKSKLIFRDFTYLMKAHQKLRKYFI